MPQALHHYCGPGRRSQPCMQRSPGLCSAFAALPGPRGSAAGRGIRHPNAAGTRHHGQAGPSGACRARRASRRLGLWRVLGNWTEGEGERKFRAERRPPSGLSVRGRKGREGKPSPSAEGFPGVPRPAGPGPRRRDPGPRDPARVAPGGRALPWRKARAGAGGSAPHSQPPPRAFTGLGPGADSAGAFSRTEGPSPGRPAGSLPAEFGARPRLGRARRGRILGPAGGSAGAAGPGAASQTGLARERTREPRESLAASRGGRPNLRSRPSRRRDPGAQVGRAGEGVVGPEGLGGESGAGLCGRGR